MDILANLFDGFSQLSSQQLEQIEKIKSFISQTFNYEPKIGMFQRYTCLNGHSFTDDQHLITNK